VADGAFLRFEGPYGTGKRYAKLPAGEFGYSDAQGLYEWRRVPFDWPEGPGTMLVRIDYSGGDRQAASGGRMHTRNSPPDVQARKLGPEPHELGFQAAVDPVRMN